MSFVRYSEQKVFKFNSVQIDRTILIVNNAGGAITVEISHVDEQGENELWTTSDSFGTVGSNIIFTQNAKIRITPPAGSVFAIDLTDGEEVE